MREVISIHIGQAGVQLGTNCWELYCLEHGLDPSGKSDVENRTWNEILDDGSGDSIERKSIKKSEDHLVGDGFSSFFMETSCGSFSPRSVFVDLEPTVIGNRTFSDHRAAWRKSDQIRSGKYRKLFTPSYLLNGNEDAANNYARGYYAVGSKMISKAIDPIMRIAESCEKLQGFMIFHSFGGGTGSGFHALLSQRLGDEFKKQNKLEISVFPSPSMSTSVVEPYNTILTTAATLDEAQVVFLSDNEAMYGICQNRLDIDNPSYLNLNRLLAQSVSSITTSLRFKGTLNTDFADFQTNLVPFPKIHFPIISYAPIAGVKSASHEASFIPDITSKCFDVSNRFVKCDTDAGMHMSCCLLYRGDVAPKDVNAATSAMRKKKNVRFVRWSPTGFKIGINNRPPSAFPDGDVPSSPKAVCMLTNNTAIKHNWENLRKKYRLMLEKKAFLHWYEYEGLYRDDFYDALEEAMVLENEYDFIEDYE